jgi:carbon monoxide dehydrogenase subunit G
MEMTGEQLIPVPQAEVWRGLNDPEVLKACIAGCETIERVTDTEYRVVMVAAVGPVKAKFNGKLMLTDLNPPNSYSLAFEGSGGAAGFGKGGASVSLKTEGNDTRLSYSAKASVGGKLAQVGSRLIDGVARKMADDFFVKFKQKLSGPAATTTATQASSAAPAAAAAHAPARMSSAEAAFNPLWFVAATLVAMMVVYWWLGQ